MCDPISVVVFMYVGVDMRAFVDGWGDTFQDDWAWVLSEPTMTSPIWMILTVLTL